MGRGQWSRWDRGMCEGCSLEIGMAFYGRAVRRERSSDPPTWAASMNSTALGEFLEREFTMHRVEELVEASMVLVLHDWGYIERALRRALGRARTTSAHRETGSATSELAKKCGNLSIRPRSRLLQEWSE
jgi:hypothetical protein